MRRHAAATSGSGLGLWIAKAFVTANGGRIEAREPGADQGTTVSIHLPFAQRPRTNPRSVPMTEANPVVLVVDDEVQIRRFLRAGLELDGFAVQDAETGADALRWATLKPPDLVILDLGLPDMDGGEVLERLRAWSSVPLIVLSVRSNEAEKVRLLEQRRRRLRGQAVRHGRAPGARACRDAPARARLGRRAGGQGRAAGDRSRRPHRDHQRRSA